MVFKHLQEGIPVEDADFDALYPEHLQQIAAFHFTPVEVAKVAAAFLVVGPGIRVLDVGSGGGKFCLIGAACTQGHFTGVEQRAGLVALADALRERSGLPGVSFIRANITDIDFSAFDAVYLFNPFHENIVQSDPIDDSIVLDKQLYVAYSLFVREQLDSMPIGTRLATYFSYSIEVPDTYAIRGTAFDRKLKLWEKTV